MTGGAHVSAASDPLVSVLRAAGSVFAEEEAALLRKETDSTDLLALWCARRVAGEPLEQIIGWVEFGDLRLEVGPGVFVPRQRSRMLAAAAADAAGALAEPMVVEAYCGVAPIAVFVQRTVGAATVSAIDADPVAVAYARRNLHGEATVHTGDCLDGLPGHLRGRIDVLAAVPPYVPDSAIGQLPHEARDHEPHTALLAGPDGLHHVRNLMAAAVDWLSVVGAVLIEINHAQYDAVAAHARAMGYTADPIVGDDGQTVVARLIRP